MRQTICLLLTLLMVVNFIPIAMAADNDVATRITAMPTGTRVEVRLKTKQKLSDRDLDPNAN